MADIRRDSKGRDSVLVKDQRYQWSMWLGIFLIMFCAVFILKAGVDGRFHSVDTLQEYIRSFGLIGPMILIAIQAFQVVIPVLPGFLGCIVGVVLFGTAGGFWCNYIGISLGSLIAFILARRFGAPLVESLFSQEHYQVWIKRIQNAKSYTLILFLCILLPLAPDDFLCYFSGLMKLSFRKFTWIILLGKPWCILAYSILAAKIG